MEYFTRFFPCTLEDHFTTRVLRSEKGDIVHKPVNCSPEVIRSIVLLKFTHWNCWQAIEIFIWFIILHLLLTFFDLFFIVSDYCDLWCLFLVALTEHVSLRTAWLYGLRHAKRYLVWTSTALTCCRLVWIKNSNWNFGHGVFSPFWATLTSESISNWWAIRFMVWITWKMGWDASSGYFQSQCCSEIVRKWIHIRYQ